METNKITTKNVLINMIWDKNISGDLYVKWYKNAPEELKLYSVVLISLYNYDLRFPPKFVGYSIEISREYKPKFSKRMNGSSATDAIIYAAEFIVEDVIEERKNNERIEYIRTRQSDHNRKLINKLAKLQDEDFVDQLLKGEGNERLSHTDQ